MSTTAENTTLPKVGSKRDISSLTDDQKHFWDLIKDFKNVFLLSRGADGTEHGRPMHIVSVCTHCYILRYNINPIIHRLFPRKEFISSLH